NPVVLYGAMLGWREARLALGLSIQPDVLSPFSPLLRRGVGGEGLSIRIPIGDFDPAAWAEAERTLDAFQIRSFAFENFDDVGRNFYEQSGYVDEDAERGITVDLEVKIPVPDTP